MATASDCPGARKPSVGEGSESSSHSRRPSLSVSIVSIDDSCATGSLRHSEEPAIYSLRVPNRLLLDWHALNQNGTNYLELLNESIDDGVVAVDVHCERLERRIAHRASSIKKTVSTRLRGRARMTQLEKTSLFDVRKGETVSATQVLLEVEETMEYAEHWRSRCRDAEVINLTLAERLREHLRRSRSRSRSPTRALLCARRTTTSFLIESYVLYLEALLTLSS